MYQIVCGLTKAAVISTDERTRDTSIRGLKAIYKTLQRGYEQNGRLYLEWTETREITGSGLEELTVANICPVPNYVKRGQKIPGFDLTDDDSEALKDTRRM